MSIKNNSVVDFELFVTKNVRQDVVYVIPDVRAYTRHVLIRCCPIHIYVGSLPYDQPHYTPIPRDTPTRTWINATQKTNLGQTKRQHKRKQNACDNQQNNRGTTPAWDNERWKPKQRDKHWNERGIFGNKTSGTRCLKTKHLDKARNWNKAPGNNNTPGNKNDRQQKSWRNTAKE